MSDAADRMNDLHLSSFYPKRSSKPRWPRGKLVQILDGVIHPAGDVVGDDPADTMTTIYNAPDELAARIEEAEYA